MIGEFYKRSKLLRSERRGTEVKICFEEFRVRRGTNNDKFEN